MSMLLNTACNGSVTSGAVVRKFTMSSGVSIPAILLGEQGRGRKLAVIPVVGAEPGDLIKLINPGRTRNGGLRFEVANRVTSISETIVVFLTTPGFRGGCTHTGDVASMRCSTCGAVCGPFEDIVHCDGCHIERGQITWLPLPGEILSQGVTAQGIAGRAGGGPQIVLRLPAGEVVREGRTGRLYGSPSSFYYRFDGERLLVATFEERRMTDCF